MVGCFHDAGVATSHDHKLTGFFDLLKHGGCHDIDPLSFFKPMGCFDIIHCLAPSS